MSSMLTNILEKAKGVLVNNIDFMEGREKGVQELGKEVTIVDFDFLSSADGDYAVYIVKEDEKNFFFGGQVLTQKLKGLQEVLSEREIEELLYHGLPVKFEEKVSKGGNGKRARNYIGVEFIL